MAAEADRITADLAREAALLASLGLTAAAEADVLQTHRTRLARLHERRARR